MKEKQKSLDVIFDSEEFNTSEEFEFEKKYAFARFFKKHAPFITSPKLDKFFTLANDYHSTLLAKIKEDYANKTLSVQENARIKENSLLVPVIVRKRKAGKENIYFETMIKDSVMPYFKTKKSLEFFLKYLQQYKQLRDRGKQEFFIFDYGKDYSTKEELRNIKMLLENTKNALQLIGLNANKKDDVLAAKWDAFLKEKLTISCDSLEYVGNVYSIDFIPEFNKLELEQIDNSNKVILNRLDTLTKIDKTNNSELEQ
ncbi:MAG: hypothetical protein CVV59_00795 [Tenericutes bacterium HGW-Tenericutes-4]|nr:MAG: hypothetical protein CVV59_00795 [Tenericutes bacterium HGW-Tenericutes-4]